MTSIFIGCGNSSFSTDLRNEGNFALFYSCLKKQNTFQSYGTLSFKIYIDFEVKLTDQYYSKTLRFKIAIFKLNLLIGWLNITNIDISLTGLQKLRSREKDSNFVQMDMSLMPFKDKTFDIVVEKVYKVISLLPPKSVDTPGLNV